MCYTGVATTKVMLQRGDIEYQNESQSESNNKSGRARHRIAFHRLSQPIRALFARSRPIIFKRPQLSLYIRLGLQGRIIQSTIQTSHLPLPSMYICTRDVRKSRQSWSRMAFHQKMKLVQHHCTLCSDLHM